MELATTPPLPPAMDPTRDVVAPLPPELLLRTLALVLAPPMPPADVDSVCELELPPVPPLLVRLWVLLILAAEPPEWVLVPNDSDAPPDVADFELLRVAAEMPPKLATVAVEPAPPASLISPTFRI